MRTRHVSYATLRIAGYAFLLVHLVKVVLVPTFTPRPTGQADDFASYYAASRLVAQGQTPYRSQDGHRSLSVTAQERAAWDLARAHVPAYVYPSFLAVAITPLSGLPFADARVAWNIVNVCCFVASIALTLLLVGGGHGRTTTLLMVGVLVAAMPTKETLVLGQANYIVLVAVLLAAWCDLRGRPILAGASLALAALVKLTPAVLLLHFLVRRDLRAASAFVVAALLVATALQFRAPGVDATFARDVLPSMVDKAPEANNKSASTWWKYALTRNDRVEPLVHAPRLARAIGTLFPLGILAAVFLGVRRVRASGDREERLGGYMIWMTAVLLVQPYLEVHHLVMATPPLAFFVARASARGLGWKGVAWAGAVFALVNSRGWNSFGALGPHWSAAFLSNPQALGLAALLAGLFFVRRPPERA